MLDRIVCQITKILSSGVAILALPVISVTLYFLNVGLEFLVFLLSVFALSFTQLVLRSTDHDTRAIQIKLDELIRSIEKADDHLIGIENEEV